jgi:hypothetical protein
MLGAWAQACDWNPDDDETAFATPTRLNIRMKQFILRMDWDPVMGRWMPFLKGDPDGAEVGTLQRLLSDSADWASLSELWNRELDTFRALRIYRRLGKRSTKKRSADGATTNSGTGVHQTVDAGAGLLGADGDLPGKAVERVGATEISGAPAVRRSGFVRIGSVWVRESESADAIKAEAVVRKRKRR